MLITNPFSPPFQQKMQVCLSMPCLKLLICLATADMSLRMPDFYLWRMQNWLKTLNWQIIIFGHACRFVCFLQSIIKLVNEGRKFFSFFQPVFPADICCIHSWLAGLLQSPCLSRNQLLLQISKSGGHLWNLLLIYPSLEFIDCTVTFRYNLWLRVSLFTMSTVPSGLLCKWWAWTQSLFAQCAENPN